MVLPGGECSCNRRLAVCQWQLGEKEEGGVSGVCVYMTIHVWREVLSNFRTTFTYELKQNLAGMHASKQVHTLSSLQN